MSSGPCKPLLTWYDRHARELPWRQTTEPYRIWVSEIMLQQTQVKTVLPRYAAWFALFPSIRALAEADIDDVMKAWEGLGYYRRARFMHRAAQQIMHEHGCIFPDSFTAIMALPGIGRSTAGAIASFCFTAQRPVLDANVKRVLQRWQASACTDTQLWALAQQYIDSSSDPARWNQAMMELGATCCTAKRADCERCPVAVQCRSAFAVDTTSSRNSIVVKDLYWQVHLHRCPERGIWLSKRPDSGIWASLWTPPISELSSAPEQPADHIHLLTHRRLHLYGQSCSTEPAGSGVWLHDFSRHAIPTGIQHMLSAVGLSDAARHGACL